MNRINFHLSKKNNDPNIYEGRTSNFIKGLEVFTVLVILGSAFIVLLGLLTDTKSIQMTGLLSYLTIILLLLGFYTGATTRTEKTSVIYNLKQYIKRLADIVLAFLMLQLLSPVLLLIAIVIKRESSGPVFYYGMRVGQFGKPFRMLRIRTMYEEPGVGLTKTGKFLRETGMNELPQLWNVLVGEMSLVGPSPRDSEILEKTLDAERKILTVKPGITGPLQIKKDWWKDRAIEDAIAVELSYVENWSLSLDLRILIKTIILALHGKSPSC